jgi:hypothetical protein
MEAFARTTAFSGADWLIGERGLPLCQQPLSNRVPGSEVERQRDELDVLPQCFVVATALRRRVFVG